APELGSLVHGEGYRGVMRPLCAPGEHGDGLQYGLGAPIVGGGGAVLVCFALDRAYLDNTRRKLGMHLAFHLDGRRLAESPGFPPGLESIVPRRVVTARAAGRRYALAAFSPPALRTAEGPLQVIAAVDVTDLRGAMERQFALAIVVIALAAAA